MHVNLFSKTRKIILAPLKMHNRGTLMKLRSCGVRVVMCECCCAPGHQQLHVQQHGHLQAPGHAADRGAGQPVRLAHRQGRLQDQGDQGGEPEHCSALGFVCW